MKNLTFGKIIFAWLLPFLSFGMLIGSFVLYKLVEERVGLHRDLIYRNKSLVQNFLSPHLRFAYIGILILMILFSINSIFKEVRKYNSRMFGDKQGLKKIKLYATLNILICSVCAAFLFFFERFESLAFPWMVVALIALSITSFLRFFHYRTFLRRS